MKTIPLFCPNCALLMSNFDDAEAFLNYGCCDDCKLHFVELNKEEWAAGNRPSVDRIHKRVQARNMGRIRHFSLG